MLEALRGTTHAGMRVSLYVGRRTGRGSGELKARGRVAEGRETWAEQASPHHAPVLWISCAVAHLCKEASCLCQLWASGLQGDHCAGL